MGTDVQEAELLSRLVHPSRQLCSGSQAAHRARVLHCCRQSSCGLAACTLGRLTWATCVLVRGQLGELSEEPVSILEKPVFMDFVEVVPVLVGIELIIFCKCLRNKESDLKK